MKFVCAHYNGITIMLDKFETDKEAEEFMKHDFVLHFADELEDADEDEIICKENMFIDNELDDLPFSEPININDVEWVDDLPF